MASAGDAVMSTMSWRSLRAAAHLALRRVELRVEGGEHLPESGPGIIAARHFHHLYDGCALVATVPRPLHIVVALDWVQGTVGRRIMDAACRMAQWPVVLRPPLDGQAAVPPAPTAERGRRLRHAAEESVSLLRAGRLLVVFPEGFPNVDPHGSKKPDDATFLPFQPGFVHFARLAERDGRTRVPIIPAGLAYQRGARWRITLRFGEPLWLSQDADRAALTRAVEARVRELSRPAPP